VGVVLGVGVVAGTGKTVELVGVEVLSVVVTTAVCWDTSR
jgi:hypothetical protein